jgi:hypothetical protein
MATKSDAMKLAADALVSLGDAVAFDRDGDAEQAAWSRGKFEDRLLAAWCACEAPSERAWVAAVSHAADALRDPPAWCHAMRLAARDAVALAAAT